MQQDSSHCVPTTKHQHLSIIGLHSISCKCIFSRTPLYSLLNAGFFKIFQAFAPHPHFPKPRTRYKEIKDRLFFQQSPKHCLTVLERCQTFSSLSSHSSGVPPHTPAFKCFLDAFPKLLGSCQILKFNVFSTAPILLQITMQQRQAG